MPQPSLQAQQQVQQQVQMVQPHGQQIPSQQIQLLSNHGPHPNEQHPQQQQQRLQPNLVQPASSSHNVNHADMMGDIQMQNAGPHSSQPSHA